MADGSTKPIEDVALGDEVQATDPTTGETGPRAVTDLIVGAGVKELVQVTLDTDGAAGDKTEVVTATGGHPFWVSDVGVWRDAKDLSAGDDVRTAEGSSLEVVGTTARTEYLTVYNLTVDGLHTFYVLAGKTPVLAHNCGETMDFAHGMTSTHADDIAANGLNGDGARAASSGGSVAQPGNLFTYRVNPGDSDTLSAAATFGGSRTGPGERPALLIFQMCRYQYDRLTAAGHITTRVTDEVSGRVEHIFGPEAMPFLTQIYRRDF